MLRGGVLMGARALGQFTSGAQNLAYVLCAWRQTAPILEAGRRARARGMAAAPTPTPPLPAEVQTKSEPLLRFEDLKLRYAADAPEALRSCSQQVYPGNRILLEGPSGGGKSTLAVVLSGLRAPDSGVLLLCGRPSAELSPARWRGQVVLAPQFYDNHILTDSLLFNLLLGRRWPATEEDAGAAFAVCEILGLRPLLERMPQGLAQSVGDGGWVLSHGERTRVFLARALLQNEAKLLILDESFAALDPETLRRSAKGILAAAPALVVIAHP
jgi:ATP-binding cassette subfamily B protein